MASEKKIKVIISNVGLDGHDRGGKVVATLLREAGMEVIYLGLFQRPESIVQAALQEDADIIGISSLSAEHLIFAPQIVNLLKQNGMNDVLFIMGGVIPVEDVPLLKEMG